MEKVTCPFCGESLYRHPIKYVLDKEYVYKCEKCQLIFNKPIMEKLKWQIKN